MEIHRERFEAWLFSQPDERGFVYSDPKNCLVCMFIKETSAFNNPEVGPLDYKAAPHLPVQPLPPFIRNGRLEKSLLAVGWLGGAGNAYSFGSVKRRYLKLFPDFSPTSDVNRESAENGGAHCASVPMLPGPGTTIHGTAHPSLETREGEI